MRTDIKVFVGVQVSKDIQSLCVKYSKPQGGIMEKHTGNEKENVV